MSKNNIAKATRPVFIPLTKGDKLVEERLLTFPWHMGMARSQRQKSCEELAKVAYSEVGDVLEVSTLSTSTFGKRLSAFNRKVKMSDGNAYFLECVFQAGKIYKKGGPFPDLLALDGREAKKSSQEKAKNLGKLVSFSFEGEKIPLNPPSAFYDWLYIRSLLAEETSVLDQLDNYKGFTDISFNPKTSHNCQARSCALFLALHSRACLPKINDSFEQFSKILQDLDPNYGKIEISSKKTMKEKKQQASLFEK